MAAGAMRPLAHYRSTRNRSQANWKAERMNRLAVEGTRCLLLQSGMPERWWSLAIQHWAACYNATRRDKEGMTPWARRHGEQATFQVYLYGALVLCKPAKGGTVSKGESDKHRTRKWRNRLAPALLVRVTQGLGGTWARSYQVVP